MQLEEKQSLSRVRYEHGLECLDAAKILLDKGNFKSAANRSYYAIFHGMRAVLAYDQIDMKHHSGIISEFRKRYEKTRIFETRISDIISELFEIRTDSDYDDFFVISKDEVVQQIDNASWFLDAIKKHLDATYQK